MFSTASTSQRTALFLAALFLSACSGGSGGSTGDAEGPMPGGEEPEITVPPAVHYSVGGVLSGLGQGKTVVLGDASGPRVSLSANGTYRIQIKEGARYDIAVLTQPAGQTCGITGGNGAGVASADVDQIDIACQDDPAPPEARQVTGSVTGLGAGQRVVLQLQSGDAVQQVQVDADGRFTFPMGVDGDYDVTVTYQPAGLTCAVTQGQGNTRDSIGRDNIVVTCMPLAFNLSGTVTGNDGTVVLRNRVTGESVTVLRNGGFAFEQPVLFGGAYAVAVARAAHSIPGYTQTCSVANGSGNATADVHVAVTCMSFAPPVIPTLPPPVTPPPPPPAVPPDTPSGVTIDHYDVKAFKLSWTAVTPPTGGGPVTYRVFEDADGPGRAGAVQVASGLSAPRFTVQLPSLVERLNAAYTVQACNTAGCSAPSTLIAPDLNLAIGYFKASNTDADDQFGTMVELSVDGSTLAVASPLEDSNATGIDGDQTDNSASASGAVYVFVRNTSGVWAQQAYVKASDPDADQFGTSLALSATGDTLAVGTRGSGLRTLGSTNNPQFDAGAVHVFTRNAGVWTEQAVVKGNYTEQGDRFGYSVALSAAGDVLAVGAAMESSNATGINGDETNNAMARSGAVYVFNRQSAAWTQQAYIKASHPGGSDYFGSAVALSADGKTLAVGAYLEDGGGTGVGANPADNSAVNSGAAYIFQQTGASWSQQAYLKATNTGIADVFGYHLALSADGNTLAVGAPIEASGATGINGDQNDESAPASGAVYVFHRANDTWIHDAYVKASNTDANDRFGHRVALSADGKTLAVGAWGEDSAAQGIGGTQSDNSAQSSGATYLYTSDAGTWSQSAYVKPSNTRSDVIYFGIGVSLSGDGRTLAVSGSQESSGASGINGDQANRSAPRAGAVYLY